eukprot:TRINITY_DN2107_c0_g1_i1.p4 TRINITY_DN2107_c0_g1~~TRINITY_DN2107_c0_g1_i1.p4  ORF type:complete len:68 (+),score=32.32 TRINITY_DN2107_c0_g1_i1:654-857(+)
MRKLHWKALPARAAQNTFWVKMKDIKLEDTVMKRLEKVFLLRSQEEAKKKKYRLRGRSSETAKAHRG